MKSGRWRVPRETALARPELFMALAHSLAVTCVATGRWAVSVDGEPLPATFGSQVEAWEAGVRAAERPPRVS